MTDLSLDQLADVLVELADTLVADFDLIEFLQTVASHAADITDADAAGVLLADPRGQLQLMAASDERARMIELFQVQNHEGPCLDAFRLREPVINVDLKSAAARWPRFARAAVSAGFQSVHAFPLRLRDDFIGVLNLFGRQTGGLEPGRARLGQALADIATIGLLQERLIRRGAEVSDQLQNALQSRIIIEQAKGVLSQTRGGTPDEAFTALRSYARQHGHRLGEVAQAVVTDPARHPGLTRVDDSESH